MIKSVEIETLLKRLTDNERRRLPQAVVNSLNKSAFEVRGEWAAAMPRIFDRPTQLTLRAPLYKKATLDNPVAEVYIRNEASGGTPPSEYLAHEAQGGQRLLKPSERILGRYYVPAPGLPRDAFGNLSGSTIRAILKQIATQGPPKPGRRRRRGTKRSAVYFMLKEARGKLQPGVYRRIGRDVQAVLVFLDHAPTYARRFDAYGLARAIFDRRQGVNLKAELLRLVRV